MRISSVLLVGAFWSCVLGTTLPGVDNSLKVDGGGIESIDDIHQIRSRMWRSIPQSLQGEYAGTYRVILEELLSVLHRAFNLRAKNLAPIVEAVELFGKGPGFPVGSDLEHIIRSMTSCTRTLGDGKIQQLIDSFAKDARSPQGVHDSFLRAKASKLERKSPSAIQ